MSKGLGQKRSGMQLGVESLVRVSCKMNMFEVEHCVVSSLETFAVESVIGNMPKSFSQCCLNMNRVVSHDVGR